MHRLSDLISEYDTTQSVINRHGEEVWIPARPLNEDYRSFWQRLQEAYKVFAGNASAITWN